MKKRIVALYLAFNLAVPYCPANPVGGSVVGGDRNGTITGSGTPITIINQHGHRIVINWQDFSIGSGEITRFIQPSSSSWALNRVIGGNPSLIYGSLQGNGHVLVINQNGIMVGPGGRIDTKGFVASTLNLSDSSFMKGGSLTLSGNSTASVRNEGTIQALGGDVFLIGNTVENKGTISAPQGTVGLAAGSTVKLVQSGNERVSVVAGNPNGAAANGVNNLGTIEGASAELKAAGGNIYALAINNQGAIRANSVVNEGGHVYLRASGGNIQNSGTISAHKADGSGGTVVLDGGHNAANPATVVNSGTIEARGDAAGTKGGKVEMVGDHVGLLEHAVVDVSGDAGGGTALIGGDAHGANPDVQNAERTYVDADAIVRADALSLGNGGKIVIWSDDITRYFGSLSARGGSQGGLGGFAEVSGHNLAFDGTANLLGAHGTAGTLLLDPHNITIQSPPPPTDPFSGNSFFADSAGSDLTFDPAAIVLALNTANVTLQANNDITIKDNINASGNAGNFGLTLQAGRDINVQANVTLRGAFTATANDPAAQNANRDTGAADFTMSTGTTIDTTAANGDIQITVSTGTGTGKASGDITIDRLNAGSGNVLVANNGVTAGSSIARASGTSLITANSVALDVSAAASGGNIGASGSAIRVETSAVEARAAHGNIFITSPNQGISIGGAALGGLTGIQASGTLSISANGNIVQTEALNVGGSSTFTAITTPGSDVLLANPGNVLGDITVAGTLGGTVRDISLRNTSSGGSALTLPATFRNLTLQFDNSGVSLPAVALSGNLNVTAGGDITETGVLDIAGTSTFAAGANNIALGSQLNHFDGTVSIVSGQDVDLRSVTTIDLGASSVSGDLTVASTTGDITDSGAVSVTGNADFTAGSAKTIVLNSGFSVSGTLGLHTSGLNGNATVVSGGGINFANSSVSGSLSVTAGGDITESGTLTASGGPSTFTIDGVTGDVLLGSQANNFGNQIVTFNAINGGAVRDVSFRNVSAGAVFPTLPTGLRNLTLEFNGAGVNLPALTLTGNLNVTAGGGDIIGAGAILVGGNADFRTTRNNDDINLSSLGVSGTLGLHTIHTSGLTGGDVTVVSGGGLNFAASSVGNNLDVTAGGNISESGAIVTGGTASFTETLAGSDILLASQANDFNGISVAGSIHNLAIRNINASAAVPTLPSSLNDLTLIFDNAAITLPGLTLSGNLIVSAGGDITQGAGLAGAIIANGPGQTATFSAGTHNITLDNNANDFNTVAVNSGNNVTLVDANRINLGASTISGNLNVSALNGPITQSGTLLVNGAGKTATFSAAGSGNDIFLADAGNDFSTIQLSGNNVNVHDANNLTFGASTISGNLLATTGGAINQSGSLNVAGLASFSSSGNGASGNITLTDGGNNFGSLGLSSANGSAVSVSEASDTALDNVTVNNGTLTVNSAGKISQVSGTSVNVSGLADFTSTGSGVSGEIFLANSGNHFGSIGLHSANGDGVVAFEADSTALDNISVPNGVVVIISGGDITQVSGRTILSGMDSLFEAPSGNSIFINNAGNTFNGTVNFLSTTPGNLLNVAVSDTAALDLAALTLDGNLTVSAAGPITESGALSVGGLASFTATGSGANGNITLNNGGNNFGSLALDSASGSSVQVTEASGTALDDVAVNGSLSVVSGGDITQVSGRTVAVGGPATFTSIPGASVLLGNVGNAFGGPVSFVSSGVGNLQNITVQNNGAFNIQGLTIDGNLNVTANGAITDNGALQVGGTTTLAAGLGNDITLDNANDFVGAVDIVSARNVTLNDVNGLTVGGTLAGDLSTVSGGATAFNTLNVGGLLTVVANGSISDNGDITVAGATTLNAGPANDITLNNANDFGGTVAIVNANNVTLADVNSLTVGGNIGGSLSTSAGAATTFNALTVGGNLTATANGLISDNGVLTVGGATILAAGAANDITLDNADNFVGPVSIVSGHNVTLNDVNSLALGNSTISGNLNVTANGAIFDSGNVTVAGATTLAAGAGNNITFTHADDFGGPVSIVSGNNVFLNDVNAIDLGASTVSGALTVVAGGNITDSGNLTVANSATFATAGGSSIILDQSGNTFNGTVSFASTGGGNLNNVTVVDTTAFDITGVAVNGTFDVTSGGPVTQSGAVVAPNFAVTSAGSVTLNSANQVGTLAIDADGEVQFREANNTTLTIGTAGGVSGINSHDNNITISADDMNIVAAINSGTADTLLQPVSVGRDLHFGPTDISGDLNLSQTELNRITAHTLTVGNATAGDVVGAGAVTKPGTVDIFQIVNGTSIVNVQSLAGQLASFLAGTTLPTPRLEVASVTGAAIDLEKAAKMLPPGSIGTLYLQVPFVPVEEKKYKVEEVSKWTTGRIAASGTTAGPQTPR
jgi:filamentous hemagglutinin family protein